MLYLNLHIVQGSLQMQQPRTAAQVIAESGDMCLVSYWDIRLNRRMTQ